MTQLDLFIGEQRKNQGISLVESNAMGFIEAMRREAIRISSVIGSVTSDDLRLYADRHGFIPHHQNAWGAIFRGKAWRIVGRKKSEIPDNHAREIRIWRYEG